MNKRAGVALTAGVLLGLASAAHAGVWDNQFSAQGMNGNVHALAATSTNLYACGAFTGAGGTSAGGIARWNGFTWSAMGSAASAPVLAVTIRGASVYAGGQFTTIGGTLASRIACWNGTSWGALGAGVAGTNAEVRAIVTSGANIYAGGTFTSAGGNAALRVAVWDGSSWSPMGTGMSGDVNALAVGSGGIVYAGGEFLTADGGSALRIARFSLGSWSALGTGLSGTVHAIAINGSDVYAGGEFTLAGGNPAFRVAKWNGSTWSALGTGVSGTVHAIAIDGADVYVAGEFTTAGGNAAFRVAKWNGSTWSALGGGPSAVVLASAATGNGDVFFGGQFLTVDTISSLYIARWAGTVNPVLIQAFSARVVPEGVRVAWDLFADEPIRGIELLRADVAIPDAPATRIAMDPALNMYMDADAESGHTYRYTLLVSLPDGREIVSSAREVAVPALSLSIGANYPNPFHPETTIPFTITQAGEVELAVFDVSGHRVATLVDGELPAGRHEIGWNGRTTENVALGSGVYFVRLAAGGATRTKRIVLLR